MKKILLITLFFFSSSAHAFSIKHNFDVHVGAFNASKTSFEYELNKNNYAIKSDVKTFGLFDSLYPFNAEYSTTGKIKNEAFETSSYRYKSQSRFTNRSKELVYDDKGNPIVSITTKNNKEKKKDIEQQLSNKDTTDLQTVFAKLAAQFNQVKYCDSTMEVFDGRRRFNVIFKDEGQEELSETNLSPFKGLASKCSMYIDKLNENSDDLLWETTSQKPVYFWILRDKKTNHPFIAKIEVSDTPLGKILVYTTQITVKE